MHKFRIYVPTNKNAAWLVIEEGNIKLGDILICDEYIYNSVRGEKIYITHGDCFDGFIRVNKFLYWLGDTSYEFSMKINKIYNNCHHISVKKIVNKFNLLQL